MKDVTLRSSAAGHQRMGPSWKDLPGPDPRGLQTRSQQQSRIDGEQRLPLGLAGLVIVRTLVRFLLGSLSLHGNVGGPSSGRIAIDQLHQGIDCRRVHHHRRGSRQERNGIFQDRRWFHQACHDEAVKPASPSFIDHPPNPLPTIPLAEVHASLARLPRRENRVGDRRGFIRID
jgi:hypothetical protein